MFSYLAMLNLRDETSMFDLSKPRKQFNIGLIADIPFLGITRYKEHKSNDLKDQNRKFAF